MAFQLMLLFGAVLGGSANSNDTCWAITLNEGDNCSVDASYIRDSACSARKAVRCCSMEGMCHTRTPCLATSTFAGAKDFCQRNDMRLCTREEYAQKGRDDDNPGPGCMCTGCDFDAVEVWISGINPITVAPTGQNSTTVAPTGQNSTTVAPTGQNTSTEAPINGTNTTIAQSGKNSSKGNQTDDKDPSDISSRSDEDGGFSINFVFVAVIIAVMVFVVSIFVARRRNRDAAKNRQQNAENCQRKVENRGKPNDGSGSVSSRNTKRKSPNERCGKVVSTTTGGLRRRRTDFESGKKPTRTGSVGSIKSTKTKGKVDTSRSKSQKPCKSHNTCRSKPRVPRKRVNAKRS